MCHALLISQNGIQSKKNFWLAGRWARRDNDPQFPDYIAQLMRGMAMNSGPQLLRLRWNSAI